MRWELLADRTPWVYVEWEGRGYHIGSCGVGWRVDALYRESPSWRYQNGLLRHPTIQLIGVLVKVNTVFHDLHTKALGPGELLAHKRNTGFNSRPQRFCLP